MLTNDELFVAPKKSKSDADPVLEFLGLAISCRDECEEVAAILDMPKGRIDKLPTLPRKFQGTGSASLATFQKLAWELRFAQTAAMERFGMASLEPIYEPIAKSFGGVP